MFPIAPEDRARMVMRDHDLLRVQRAREQMAIRAARERHPAPRSAGTWSTAWGRARTAAAHLVHAISHGHHLGGHHLGGRGVAS